MSEKKLSKYAAKVAARRESLAAQTSVALNVIAKLECGQSVQPKTPTTKAKPVQKPPEPRGLLAYLGDAQTRCAEKCCEAARLLREALACAQAMQGIAKRGRQMGEVLSLIGIIGALPDKAAYAAARALGIPTLKADNTESGAQ